MSAWRARIEAWWMACPLRDTGCLMMAFFWESLPKITCRTIPSMMIPS